MMRLHVTALARDLDLWTRSRLQELVARLRELLEVPQYLADLQRRLRAMETARGAQAAELAELRAMMETARAAQAAELAELRRLVGALPQRVEVLGRGDPLVAYLRAEITAEARRQDLIRRREETGAEISVVADPEWQRLWTLRQDALMAAHVPPAPIAATG